MVLRYYISVQYSFYFQYEYRPWKPHDPSDVLGFKQEVSEKLPQG